MDDYDLEGNWWPHITKFFKDAPSHWGKITIRHLLNHTSGLQRESPAFEAMVEKPDSVLIRAAYKDSLAFPTGTKWQYCNLSYFILADIIRQISGQPFATYMKEQIFIKNGGCFILIKKYFTLFVINN